MSSIVVDSVYGGGGGAGTVTSVNGDAGPVVVLDNTEVGAAATVHTHVAANVTDFSAAADARIGAAVINALSDVVITAPADTQVLTYNSGSGNWINSAGGGATDFADNVFRISDNTTSSKKLAFEVSGVTTATVRTATVPDRNFTFDQVTSATTTAGFNTAAVMFVTGSGPQTVGALDSFVFSGGNAAPVISIGNNVNTRQTDVAAQRELLRLQYISFLSNTINTGPAISFDGWISSAIREMGRIDMLWEDVTLGTRSSRMVFNTVSQAGALTERLRITSEGLQTQTVVTTATNTLVQNYTDLRSSGTVANGFGLRSAVWMESSTTNTQSAFIQDVLWTDATHASRTSSYGIQLTNLATTSEVFLIAGTGIHTHTITAASAANMNVVTYRVNNGGGAGSTALTSTLLFQLESTTTTNQDAAGIRCSWVDATHASRKGQLEFMTYDAGAGTTVLTVRSNGGTNSVLALAGSNGIFTINGTQVLGVRNTGWTAGTGTENKGSINYDTVAFDVTGYRALAQRVLALEAMARTHGLIN